MILLLLPLFLFNTLVHAMVAFQVVAFARRLVPVDAFRRACTRALFAISFGWTNWNTRFFGLGGFRVRTTMAPGVELRRDKRYLLMANHQSWTDILVLHAVFHPATPFLAFFIKSQLRHIPFFGRVWTELGFPFMKRYSAEAIAKDPSLKGRDLETTREFCRSIRGQPYAIINFVEGTRRTPKKAAKSPFRHLLPPKAGGVATTLQALEYEFDHVLDVTIRYAHEKNRFIDLLSGRVGLVDVDVREIPLGAIPRGDYFADARFADEFRSWLNDTWRQKDERFGGMVRVPERGAA